MFNKRSRSDDIKLFYSYWWILTNNIFPDAKEQRLESLHYLISKTHLEQYGEFVLHHGDFVKINYGFASHMVDSLKAGFNSNQYFDLSIVPNSVIEVMYQIQNAYDKFPTWQLFEFCKDSIWHNEKYDALLTIGAEDIWRELEWSKQLENNFYKNK